MFALPISSPYYLPYYPPFIPAHSHLFWSFHTLQSQNRKKTDTTRKIQKFEKHTPPTIAVCCACVLDLASLDSSCEAKRSCTHTRCCVCTCVLWYRCEALFVKFVEVWLRKQQWMKVSITPVFVCLCLYTRSCVTVPACVRGYAYGLILCHTRSRMCMCCGMLLQFLCEIVTQWLVCVRALCLSLITRTSSHIRTHTSLRVHACAMDAWNTIYCIPLSCLCQSVLA